MERSKNPTEHPSIKKNETSTDIIIQRVGEVLQQFKDISKLNENLRDLFLDLLNKIDEKKYNPEIVKYYREQFEKLYKVVKDGK